MIAATWAWFGSALAGVYFFLWICGAIASFLQNPRPR